MNTKPITESEYASLRISALPSRPTASSAFGGKGYTASQLKEAFDRLPLLLIERFNSLLEDLEGTGKGSLVSTIPTGLESNHTLAQFFEDVKNGMLATYLSVEGEALSAVIAELQGSLEKAERLCADAESGALADTLPVGGEPLSAVIARLSEAVDALQKNGGDGERSLDGGHPKDRI